MRGNKEDESNHETAKDNSEIQERTHEATHFLCNEDKYGVLAVIHLTNVEIQELERKFVCYNIFVSCADAYKGESFVSR